MTPAISSKLPVLIAGPTASGKSGLALEIAKREGGVIVNADAQQVYDCWQDLSARPTAVDLARTPHLLYGHIAHDQDYSVGHWLREVATVLAKLKSQQLRPIIVGGTGLYFTALTEGLAQIPSIPAQIRDIANKRRVAGDLVGMRDELDITTLSRIDTKNGARVQRAWEVMHATGRALSAWQDDTPAPLLPLYECHPIVFRPNLDWLNARIDQRFDQMMQGNALDEVRLAAPTWNPNRPSARAIGAPELMAHIAGQMSLDDAVVAAKLASRQYAKRQRTWFRSRMKDWHELIPPAYG
ncbi:MAG: tRNA dimethylallyltransferase [Paracoccaceae bacterium]|jgi:tRNA dimethylallyltransferase